MIAALYVFVGAALALLVDWATYTHLGAFIGLGFPTTPIPRYREIALGSPMALGRTIAVGGIGAGAGLTFAFEHASLWLVAMGLFVLAHAALYALVYMRSERS